MANFGRGPGWGNRPGQSGSTAGSGTTTSQRRGGPDRRGGGLGAQGQLTKRQKEAIADAQRQKNLQRDAMQRQQRLQDEMNQQIEARRLQKLEEQRQQRLQDEMNQQIEARRLEEQRLAEAELARLKKDESVPEEEYINPDIVEQDETLEAIDQLLKEQASNFRPPVFETAPSEDILSKYKEYVRPPVFETQPMKGGIIENYQTLPKIVADNPNIFGQNANPNDYEIMTDEFGNDVVYTKDLKQKMGTVGLVEDLPGWLGMGAGMLFGKDTPMFTADPLLAQDAARGPGDRGQGNELGLSPAVYAQIQAEAQAAAAAEAEAAAATQQPSSTEEILTGFAPQYTTSPATSGIATVPTTGNYMDYMQYAFRPVNTANPWAGSPTQNITGYNPLFADNPVYAADGGRINKMSGGMMIMGDEGVVNNGIGGILSKYKEIRSEL